MPGTACRRRRTVHSATWRRSMASRVSEVSPTRSTVRVEEVSGVMAGAATPSGMRPDRAASRSLTRWRTRSTSLPDRKAAVITDRPWMEVERRVSSPGRPPTATSTGWVTSTSTCSESRPGASVWIVTIGGANSGKTS